MILSEKMFITERKQGENLMHTCRVLQGDKRSTAACSRKRKTAKVCVKSTKREGINCTGDS